MPLFDVFWSLLFLFLWIVWFWILIGVVADIFASEDLSGWGKAAWVLLCAVLPYVGVLVYMIARGSSMQERVLRRAHRQEQAAREYIRDVAHATPSEELTRLAELRDAGVLSDSEFEAQKQKVLSAA